MRFRAPHFGWRHFERVSRLTFLFTLLAAVPAGLCAVLVYLDCHNDVIAWSDPDADVRRNYQRFRDAFGQPETIVVSWPGCSLNSPQCKELEQRIEASDTAGLFASLVSGEDVVEQLTEPPLGLSPDAAIERLRGSLVGPARHATGLVATLSDAGSDRRGEALECLENAAAAEGIAKRHLRMGGSGYLLARADVQSVASPVAVAPLILGLVGGLLWWRLGSLRLMLGMVVMAAFVASATMALVYASGVRMNAIVSTLPTLVFLICVSNCLHLANYFLSARAANTPQEAMRRALGLAWQPTLFSGLTTALGLLSLLASDTRPIQQFGLFGALGVALSTGAVLLVFPQIAQPKFWHSRGFERVRQRYAQRRSSRAWRHLTRITVTYRWPVLLAALAALPVLLLGIGWLTTTVRVDAFFKPQSAEVQSARWLEAEVADLESLEMLIEFGQSACEQSRHVERLMLVASLAGRLRQVEGVSEAFCLERFTPPLSFGRGMRATARRSVVDGYLEKNWDRLEQTRLVCSGESGEIWRISARISAFADVDTIRPEVQREVAAFSELANRRVQANYFLTGTAILFRDVEKQFLSDLARTYATGFLIVSVVVLLVLRKAVAAGLAMIPNSYPAALVLGAVGWAGWKLDVGSIMTASVALGIAVDDTLHLLIWARRELANGARPHRALRSALGHCGSAMTQTSVICGAGTALFAVCSFLPTVRFGLLLSTMLLSALVADLVILPALIAVLPRAWAPAKLRRHKKRVRTSPARESSCLRAEDSAHLAEHASLGATS